MHSTNCKLNPKLKSGLPGPGLKKRSGEDAVRYIWGTSVCMAHDSVSIWSDVALFKGLSDFDERKYPFFRIKVDILSYLLPIICVLFTKNETRQANYLFVF